ncbi:hypothetical protein [Microbacterium sp.]|uniref:hypothetical protein n=1 Tax=Microbacterium sp. TaxID=51671 RepID=UPI003F965CFB
MPLDEFATYSSRLDNYAEQLLLGQCLNEHGYEWDVPWQDTDFVSPANFNHVDIRLFNVEIATQWGYQSAPSLDLDSLDAWHEFTAWANSYDPDADFVPVFEACRDGVRSPKSVENLDNLNYIMGLKIQAEDVTRADETVVSATKEWRTCLVEAEVGEIPMSFEDMPTAQMVERFRTAGAASSGGISPEEIAVAAADAECRDSSGLSAARYDAQWNAEAELVEANRDKLERIRDDADEYNKEVLTTVAENAPSH